MSPERTRAAALSALWSLVAATLALVAYGLLRSPLTDLGLLTALRGLLAAAVLAGWTLVFTRYSAAQPTPVTDPAWRALRGLFPWLTSLRLALWMLTVLSVSGAVNLMVSSVALTAVLTVELGFILAKNAVYGTLVRHAATPGEALGRTRLQEWLNVAAALSLGLGVVNVVPLGDMPWSWAALPYGLHAALDVLAGVLALRAVQLAPPGPESSA